MSVSKPSLSIVSHTEHYIKSNGDVVGFEPTVREINNLLQIFDKIYHIAPLSSDGNMKNHVPYSSNKVIYIPLKKTGGKGVADKLSIILHAPSNLFKIKTVISKTDWVQFRSPANIGIYLLPYLYISNRYKVWVKYAGSWIEPYPPISYRFQRWFLKMNFLDSKVTVNGSWPGQLQHIVGFENPCFTLDELKDARIHSKSKSFDSQLSICFVGELVKNKGADIFLESLSMLDNTSDIDTVYIVGDGTEMDRLKDMIDSRINTHFLGLLSRQDLNLIYQKSHIFILPSKTEGFPKVLSESIAFGCVPVVSNVSAISQYIGEENGVLLDSLESSYISNKIKLLMKDRARLRKLSIEAQKISKLFTYSRYNSRIQNEIIND